MYILVKLELIDFLFCTCLNQFNCKTNIGEQLGYNNFLNDVLKNIINICIYLIEYIIIEYNKYFMVTMCFILLTNSIPY